MPNIFIDYKTDIIVSTSMMTKTEHENQCEIPLFPILFILISLGIMIFRLFIPL